MKAHELTNRCPPAKSTSMQDRGHDIGKASRLLAAMMLGTGMIGSGMLAGCVSVTAPDKPIVIELNINIKQEVVYRIAKDVANTIDQNPEVF